MVSFLQFSPTKTYMHISSSHTCCMSRPSHPNNIRRGVQIMRFLIIQPPQTSFSDTRHYFNTCQVTTFQTVPRCHNKPYKATRQYARRHLCYIQSTYTAPAPTCTDICTTNPWFKTTKQFHRPKRVGSVRLWRVNSRLTGRNKCQLIADIFRLKGQF